MTRTATRDHAVGPRDRDKGTRSKGMTSALAGPPMEAAASAESLSREEVRAFLDRRAQRCLGISGEGFRRRWDAGEYAADPDRAGVVRLAMLLPFAQ